MYEDFYGFVQSPFTLTPDPRFFYPSEAHDEAIRQLLQSIRRKEGFIVLTGDIGTGKTTLSRTLLEQLGPNTFTAHILNPFLSVEEMLRDILLDFGVVSREAVRSGRASFATKHELASTLHDFLLSLAPIHSSAVLVIDEAQHLSPQVLEELRVLSNLETNESKLLQIVLVGQLNLLEVLADAGMRQLEQRVSLRATLRPLTRAEVKEYITHRLAVAKGNFAVRFDPSAIDRAYLTSGGVPRVINLLCDRALMLGAEANTAEITEGMIQQAAAGLAIEKPAAPVSRWRRALPWAAILVVILILFALAALFTPMRGI
jgi:general secretion pathway protein A